MLPPQAVVLLAAIQGVSEALPVSRSGHSAVASLWLHPGSTGVQLELLLHLATASALLIAARRRLVAALGAGLLAIARPSLIRSSAPAREAVILALALLASLGSRAFVDQWVFPWRTAPVAIGFGLLFTGLLMGTTTLIDEPGKEEPSMFLALVLGIGHGLANLPGGSDMGAALVLLSWMRTKTEITLDLAMILSAGTLLLGVATAPMALVRPEISWPVLLLALTTAFLGTSVAIRLTRLLLEKRALALVACWTFPLGLGMLAYSRALSDGLSLALAVLTRPG